MEKLLQSVDTLESKVVQGFAWIPCEQSSQLDDARLRVNISDLHVRFEDVPPASCGRPVCLGIQLASLCIVTTDANGQELFVDEEERDQTDKTRESREGPPVRVPPVLNPLRFFLSLTCLAVVVE